jgi:hypothetical protein
VMDTEIGRVVLWTKTPPDLVARNWILVIFFGSVLMWASFTTVAAGNSRFVALGWLLSGYGVLALIAYVQVLMNKGYRLSYDDTMIFFRPDGFKWNLRYLEEWTLRYEDIDKIVAEPGRMNMQPFEFIHLWRATWDGRERFFVSRMFLKDVEIREFLRFLYTKCPDKFPPAVMEFMNIADEPY